MKQLILPQFTNPHREEEQDVAVLDYTDFENRLVVHNDDFNTFDFVIESLISICDHTPEQAEQCTLLIHFKGKCTVKSGSLDKLKPMHHKLLSRGLTSEIV
ncbi:MAG: ATP-dependent Clp protease adaptor ClpS [Chryseobacterium sp.]|nr:MAG: ATP-dependent Clp protease adaptor ClpS [Chryseobacterium sp.]